MNKSLIPAHVAIIPDGNRRWAAAHKLQPWDGHEEGSKRIAEITRVARDVGVTHLSLWGSSLENLTKRPLRERRALLSIYDTYFDKLLTSDDLVKEDVRINVFGQWQTQLPKSLCDKIAHGIAATKSHKKYFLNFFIAYSGDDEMVHAVAHIIRRKISPDDLTKQDIKNALMTKDLPPVDYMIRTGGEPHLSTGFMMWDTANAQLYFTKQHFPDFDAQSFRMALEEYATRARRHGA